MKPLLLATLAFVVFVLSWPLVAATTIYVDDDNTTGPWDGTAAHPYNKIQDGIDAATGGDTVLVADGTYTGAGNRDLDFGGKAITVRSEHGPETCIIDCQGSEEDPHRGFFFHSGETSLSLVDGFTIRHGFVVEGEPFAGFGGGIGCQDASPSIMNCVVVENSASSGGGLGCNMSRPELYNCRFEGNSASRWGGAVSCWNGSNLTMNKCQVVGNSARDSGGGIRLFGSDPAITSCTLSGNSTRGDGGAISSRSSSEPVLTNCMVVENYAAEHGGAFYIDYVTYPSSAHWSILNCTIRNNIAVGGDQGISVGHQRVSVDIRNTILWNNGGAQVSGGAPDVTVEYCVIEGGWSGPGTGNIDADPQLRPDGWLTALSPCRNLCPSGASTDIDGETRPFPVGGMYDAGADEFVSSDGDGLPDWWEAQYYGNAGGDPDGDGLWNVYEYNHATDPGKADTDGDGRNDGDEIASGTDPLHPDSLEGKYYVNTAVGDDGYDGLAPEWDGTHGPKATIQAGIDATLDGHNHTVIVADGTYTGDGNRDLFVLAKAITIRSESGPLSTVVDCEGTYSEPHQGFVFEAGGLRTCVLEGFTITHGYAGSDSHREDGGGVSCCRGDLTVRNCRLTSNAAHEGGAVWGKHSDLTLEQCALRGNGAGNTGGGAHFWACDVVISACTIYGGLSHHGGGIYSAGGSVLLVTDSTISGNTADYEGGGIRCAPPEGQHRFENTAFRNNTAPKGGAIFYRGEGPPLTLVGCELSANVAHQAGGGVYCYYGCSLEAEDCVIEGNEATEDGGGIYCYEDCSLEIRGGSLSANSAHTGAGAFAYLPAGVTLTGVAITHNEATYRAGGVYMSGVETAAVTNCLFIGNTAEQEAGGLYCHGSSPTITNCTFYGNSATEGGGLYTYHTAGLPVLTNCILWGDVPEEIFVSSGTPTLDYCDIQGGWTGAGSSNLDVDPLLKADGHLNPGSPCIDYCPTGAATDVDGQPRPLDMIGVGYDGERLYDIGADEFFDTDEDGMDDDWEEAHGFDPNDPTDAGLDADGDGLTNLGEFEWGCDPHDPDTDDDGTSDGDEVAAGTNPLYPDNLEKTFYVNGATGDDAWDGLTPEWDGTHGPKATIQAGIDATVSGWDYTVLVADGTYTGDGNRDIVFDGKLITVASEHGAELTIIDCEGSESDAHRAFNATGFEAPGAVIQGFTITNGHAGYVGPDVGTAGGGIVLTGNATIRRCIIEDCYAWDNGGAIACYADTSIESCIIRRNAAHFQGGGVYSHTCTLQLTNCLITDNEATFAGGGACCEGELSNHAVAVLSNCTFTRNVSLGFVSGALRLRDCDATATNCIFWGDQPREFAPGPTTLSYCIAQGSSYYGYAPEECLDVDPQLTADGHPEAASPCIDWCPTGPATDLAGTVRPIDVPGVGFDGERPFDIGAYEVQDTDGDGMGDAWETEHGLDPNDPSDATLDADGDGLLNVEEFAFGSDPQDPESPAFIYVDDDAAGSPVQGEILANPYESIQLAIDAATPPAVVKVLAGTYNEAIVIPEGVWVVGSGPATTTINAGNTGHAVEFVDASDGLLAGFAVTSGGTGYQGLKTTGLSSPTIRHCTFTASRSGMGLAGDGAPHVVSCLIAGNPYQGIFTSGTATPTIINCTIADNGAKGVVKWGSGPITIINSILWGNADDINGASITASYCNIGDGDFEGVDGNISADPLFEDTASGNYRLLPGSPCIDAGTSDGAPSLDMAGAERWDDGTVPNTGAGDRPWYDIGAYEQAPAFYVDDDAPGDPAPGDPSVSDLLEDGSAAHPFDAIQEGIDAASPGDMVGVADGMYTGDGNRNLDFRGKAITLRSQSGPEHAIVNCEGTRASRHRGFHFHSDETAASVVEGFTICGGNAHGGGGILFCSSSPTIINCALTGNSTHFTGGGIFCLFSSPTLSKCTLTGNSARPGGGAVFCSFGSPTLTNCVISGNEASACGGAICSLLSSPTLTSCTIAGNVARGIGSAIFCAPPNGMLTLTNCILWGNGPRAIHPPVTSSATLSYCDIEGGWPGAGNLDADPLFADPASGDYRIGVDSPCFDRATAVGAPPDDVEGNPRPYAWGYDIGAYEFTGTDVDGDGLPDEWEIHYFGHTGYGPDDDPDDDGLTNWEEGQQHTNPNNPDTDGDGLPDGWEVGHGLDPTDDGSMDLNNGALGDPDGDGLDNQTEYGIGTHPNNPDTDNDGRTDGDELADGTNPTHPDNVEMTYYVNGTTGDDAYDGLAAVWDGAHGPKWTIQAGIDATLDGWDHTVLVADGTYTGEGNRDLDFHGKAITTRGQNGPDVTIIDCESSTCGFSFSSGETPDSVVDGFTIRNGVEESLTYLEGGGGIKCAPGSPTIANCVITHCSAAYSGGGIYIKGVSSPVISACVITDNTVTYHRGGGVSNEGDGTPVIVNCVIARNTVGLDGRGAGNGGGIYHGLYGAVLAVNCTIVENVGQYGGGAYLYNPGTFVNCIIYGNTSLSNPGEQIGGSGEATVSYSNIEGGWPGEGNIDADPGFVNAASGDYHLLPDSPCIDAGASDETPPTDMEGESRWDDPGTPNTGGGLMPYYDIGADECVDQDSDGLPDHWEIANGLDPADDGSVNPDNGPLGDPDSDGLTNVEEYHLGSDPHNPDMDDDGRTDGHECSVGTNPFHPDNNEKTYYVNGTTGDDLWDGLAKVWDGTHGPKWTIQAGIDATVTGWDYTVEVADGTYTGDGNRDLDFQGKAITVMSENGVANVAIDCEGSESAPHRGAYFHSGETAQSVLAAVTIRNGFGQTGARHGGGILIRWSSPTIHGCVIRDCHADERGGGVAAIDDSAPTITNCTIVGNRADEDGGGVACHVDSPALIQSCVVAGNTTRGTGGGVWMDDSNVVMIDCDVAGNSSDDYGGGLFCEASQMLIQQCRVYGNESVADDGGGIYIAHGSGHVANCLVYANTARDWGGGIQCSYTDATIVNCTVVGNTSSDGGGVSVRSRNTGFTNCIIWGNAPDQVGTVSASPVFAYCDIQNGTGELWFDPATCIDTDPLFVSGPLHDHYLSQTAAGQAADSPCVDAGSDTAAMLGLDELTTRTDGGPDTGLVDLGYHAPCVACAITDVLWDEAATSVVITFGSRPGVGYVVEAAEADAYSDELAWTDLTVMTAAAVETTVTDDLSTNPLGHAFRFYRVERVDESACSRQTAAVFELDLDVGFALRQFCISTPLVPDPDHDSVQAALGTQIDYSGMKLTKLTAETGLFSCMVYEPGAQTWLPTTGTAFGVVAGEAYMLDVGSAIPVQHTVRLTGTVPETPLELSVTRASFAVTARWMACGTPRPSTLAGLGLETAITPSWEPTNEVCLLPLGATVWSTYRWDGVKWYDVTTPGVDAGGTPIACGEGIVFIHNGMPAQPDTLTLPKWYLRPPNAR